MAEPPATALSVPVTDSTRECVDLPEGATSTLMLPSADTMIELRAHEEPELQVWVALRAWMLSCWGQLQSEICAHCEVRNSDGA